MRLDHGVIDRHNERTPALGGGLTVEWSELRERGARLVVFAILLSFGLATTIANLTNWQMADVNAYWSAAERLRDGLPLYSDMPIAEDLYVYAPWFAYLWVPLLDLPRGAVNAVWSMLLLAASLACVWPALRTRSLEGVALAGLLFGLLVRTASTGNVQPLLLAALVWGIHTRYGPWIVGAITSLKVAPALFVLPWVAEGQWRKVILTGAVALVMGLHGLAYNWLDYPTLPMTGSHIESVVIGGAGIVLALVSPKYRWLGAAIAVMFVLPRQYPYTLAYLLVAVSRGTPSRS